MAMADYPYPADFLMPMPAWPVEVACEQLAATKESSGLLAGLAAAAAVYYNYEGTSTCNDVSVYATSSLGGGWDYQSMKHFLPKLNSQGCTEMVFPISSNGTSDMFLPEYFDLGAWVTECQEAFGVTPRPLWFLYTSCRILIFPGCPLIIQGMEEQ